MYEPERVVSNKNERAEARAHGRRWRKVADREPREIRKGRETPGAGELGGKRLRAVCGLAAGGWRGKRVGAGGGACRGRVPGGRGLRRANRGWNLGAGT